jgi:catechol 2,3-dioxygenase-like lactoylglutathione lyase family enzyme
VARLQHVAATFPPGGEPAIRRFYGDVLGLAEMPVPDEVADQGWIWFATDDEGVELHFIPDEPAPDPARRHHFCLQFDSLDDVRERLAAAGAQAREPGSRILGRERLFTRDPVGNLVECVVIAGPVR